MSGIPAAGSVERKVAATRANPLHTPFHPKWYRRRVPIFWWLGKGAYAKFIVRELTSLAVAYTVLALLALIWALGRAEAAYERLLSWMSQPAVVALHALVFLALLYHTITWLNLAPRALVVRMGKRRVPDWVVVAVHYLAWAAASAIFLYWLLGV
jgi:fumarate reductase subunit C